jgi:hypothetical protein
MAPRRWLLGLVFFLVVMVVPVVPAESAPMASGQSPDLTTLPRPDGNLEGFGYSVAIWADTAVVVALETDTASGRGEAFVYSRGARGWSATPVATLTAPAAGEFGTVVALSGTTLAISDPVTSPESVDLYTEGADGWPTTPTVIETDPDAPAGRSWNDAFGQALAISGDTLVVGAANVGGNGNGVVDEYTEGPGGWPTTPTATLADPGRSPTNRSNDGFGEDVAVSGTTVMVGAYGTGGDGEPVVDEYTEGSQGWPTAPTMTLTDPQPSNDCFGESGLAISGTDAIIGGGCDHQVRGVVYAYHETGSGWGPAPVATLTDPARGGSNYFGTVEALSDGTAVVGAFGYHHRQGRAYVYAMNDNGGWSPTPITVLQGRPGTGQSEFGYAVGLSGSTAIIGADGADEDGKDGSQFGFGLAYLAEV